MRRPVPYVVAWVARAAGSAVLAGCAALAAAGSPHATGTQVLGPFLGSGAPTDPPTAPAVYGTDLGWSYVHDGRLRFLFGDTSANGQGAPVDPLHDDVFGSLDLAPWGDGASISPGRLPRLSMATGAAPGTLATLDPGVPMEPLKTPVGGFSDGRNEYALFITGKPRACRVDADCGGPLQCDAGLGTLGAPAGSDAGLTLSCRDGSPRCNGDPLRDRTGSAVPGSGLCVDRGSTLWADDDWGRVAAAAVTLLIGKRSESDPARYVEVRPWLTNRFANVAVRAVGDSGPAYARHRLLLWGRPWFVGVNARGRTLGLYFAYVDLPLGKDPEWRPHYFSGLDARGRATFSLRERDALPLDLDAGIPGPQPRERHDVVNQMSVAWSEPLRKWLMFYGGGISRTPVPGFAPECGVLQVFVRDACNQVDAGNGALRMRTAGEPWGPWSDPQDLLVGGDPDASPPADQYAPGGVLHHPDCTDPRCLPGTPYLPASDYGWLYGANIITPWMRPAGDGVDVIWNASTWDPYRVILLRTHIAAGGR